MRSNKGLIGARNLPTGNDASGIISIVEAQQHRSVLSYPSTDVPPNVEILIVGGGAGGTITTINVGGTNYTVHTFTGNDNFVVAG